jgi:hypothetical protein
MADQKTLADLRKCMRAAKGDPGKMDICEQAFVAAGGTVTPGVTLDQGKVFSLPDGSEEAFVTNRGKVF